MQAAPRVSARSRGNPETSERTRARTYSHTPPDQPEADSTEEAECGTNSYPIHPNHASRVCLLAKVVKSLPLSLSSVSLRTIRFFFFFFATLPPSYFYLIDAHLKHF